jgi:hypothetical protein
MGLLYLLPLRLPLWIKLSDTRPHNPLNSVQYIFNSTGERQADSSCRWPPNLSGPPTVSVRRS